MFQAAVTAGHLWLAVAAVLLSLVGAFYYLRVVKLMYFDEPRDEPREASQPVAPVAVMGSVLSLNGLALLWFGILPGGLMAICIAAVANLVPG